MYNEKERGVFPGDRWWLVSGLVCAAESSGVMTDAEKGSQASLISRKAKRNQSRAAREEVEITEYYECFEEF